MFNEAEFQRALTQPRLQKQPPEYLAGNRAGGRVRVKTEQELMAMTRQWFEEYEKKIEFYASKGFDIAWTLEWAKKYWWSWLMRDMSHNDELYTQDLRYVDPTTFGRELVGLKEFVDYNFAFFEAIPDWRYDPLPGQVYIDLTPEGETRIVIRYVGSGHFSGGLKFHPYDDNAPTLHGTGMFVQATAVDRYHFNSEGKMYFGETLWDFIEATQSAGIMPAGDSWQIRSMMKASKLPGLFKDVREQLNSKLPFKL